ncbi:D-aspartate oxidase-like isoform X1 [Macrobrachium nipponense]|uniref:D-aspartate oxidase-like isoform X1 n=2 Tax=Macrobrachium nipponense TaxID=159736 RepID=UPI0030C7D041
MSLGTQENGRIHEQDTEMVRIAVVGAGVVGLTSANLLQEAIPGASVTIIADRFGQDTVSDVAAGLYRPGLQFQGPNQEVTEKWLRDAYAYYKEILNSEDADEAGVKRAPGYIFSTNQPKIVKNFLMEPVVDEFRPCTQGELDQYNMKYGSYIVTILTECRRFLPYMTRKFQNRGGQIIQRYLNSLEELAGDYDIVCNCCGFGAKDLCGDNFVTPMRGQVFKVRAPWIKHFYYVDYDTYILPGFDSITLGGTRQFDSYNTEVCKHDAASIWERCTNFLPSLKKAQVLKEAVGLRPYRSIVRVEKELMKFDNGKTLKVVHNYGHGGYGVMAAPGTSIHAVSLVKEMLGLQSKL